MDDELISEFIFHKDGTLKFIKGDPDLNSRIVG